MNFKIVMLAAAMLLGQLAVILVVHNHNQFEAAQAARRPLCGWHPGIAEDRLPERC